MREGRRPPQTAEEFVGDLAVAVMQLLGEGPFRMPRAEAEERARRTLKNLDRWIAYRRQWRELDRLGGWSQLVKHPSARRLQRMKAVA